MWVEDADQVEAYSRTEGAQAPSRPFAGHHRSRWHPGRAAPAPVAEALDADAQAPATRERALAPGAATARAAQAALEAGDITLAEELARVAEEHRWRSVARATIAYYRELAERAESPAELELIEDHVRYIERRLARGHR